MGFGGRERVECEKKQEERILAGTNGQKVGRKDHVILGGMLPFPNHLNDNGKFNLIH